MEGSTETQAGRLHLLLVDDCESERDLYRHALEDDFDVLTASRGTEALALVTRTPPDVIVLDVIMPGIDGWETCTRIKRDEATSDIPVIMLTGADDSDLSEHAIAVGASTLLRKPCAPDRLREAILGIAAQRRFHRTLTPRSRPASILIVDDDPNVTDTFGRLLETEGYEVRTALDAESALHEIEAHRPDAILLDLRLPIVNGLAFLRRLRANEGQRRTPVAFITGDYFLDDDVLDELRELGAELYFKPVWLEDLASITQELLATRDSRRHNHN